MSEPTTKVCTKCNVEKDLSEFNKNSNTFDGLSNWCKSCDRAHSREYRQAHLAERQQKEAEYKRAHSDEDKARAREYYHKHKKDYQSYIKRNPHVHWRSNLKRNYQITPEDYERILVIQGGKCAICGRDRQEFPKPLVVDHDHDTGKVRGLLCPNCNHGLGRFSDSIDVVAKALEYLRKEPYESNTDNQGT